MTSTNKIVVVLMLCCITTWTKAQDKIITYAQLPTKAQSFVKTHYSQSEVLQVMEDTEYLVKKEYKVILKNNVKLEFDKNGEWTEVDAERSAVPQKLVPTSIQQYVNKNFPQTHITQIKKEPKKFEVELSSGLDLEFNAKGEFLRIDD